jgi:hypothetical protein
VDNLAESSEPSYPSPVGNLAESSEPSCPQDGTIHRQGHARFLTQNLTQVIGSTFLYSVAVVDFSICNAEVRV